MKMIALLGAVALAGGGLTAAPAAAQYHHGDHGRHGYHGDGYRGHAAGGYRGDYGYRDGGYRHGGYHRGWGGYAHRRVVCNRFGRCHRI